MYNVFLVNLDHTVDDLRKNFEVVLSINDSKLILLTGESNGRCGVSGIEILLERVLRAELHLDHEVEGVVFLASFDVFVHGLF